MHSLAFTVNCSNTLGSSILNFSIPLNMSSSESGSSDSESDTGLKKRSHLSDSEYEECKKYLVPN